MSGSASPAVAGLINSWAMIYPKAERRFYNRVVEAVAQTYSPGAGRTGQCD